MSRVSSLIIGVVSPAAQSLAEPTHQDPPLAYTILPGAAVGIAGVALWKNHRVLGFLAGDALGVNAYRLYRGQGDDRARALSNLGVAATSISGSLMWKKHPFWGWVLGFVAGSVVTSFVPGSNAYKLKTERST